MAAAAVCAIALSARVPAGREIHIVARGMTFYLDGAADPNPTVRVRRGESVRIVFRNDDPGMKHDFTVPAWGVETKMVRAGAETSIDFRAPAGGGDSTYACTPHATMMRGTIAVE